MPAYTSTFRPSTAVWIMGLHAPAMLASDKNFDPVSLHRQNVLCLNGGDTVVAGYFGSGAALLGNVLLELGLAYVDLYTEQLVDGARSHAAAERVAYRRRLKATCISDEVSSDGRSLPASGRFVKTHLPSSEFAGTGVRSVVLLVRDPRDAVCSYYHWRVGFGEEPETRTFDEFLRDGPPNVGPPARAWATFNEDWLSYGRTLDSCSVVRFEALKRDPVGALRPMIEAARLDVSHADLREAASRSSFQSMREHEDAIAGAEDGARIMRRGVIDEWVEWWTPERAKTFNDPQVWRIAATLGYPLDSTAADGRS